MEKTSFAYTADDTLRSNVNYIYSPTLLFAWNHLLEDTKSSLLHGSEFAQSIDTALGHLNSLNEDEYEKSFIIESPHFIVTTSFSKSLSFREEFKRNNTELKFDNIDVETFGCYQCGDKTKSQIEILYYNNDSDFAVALATEDPLNEILLFKPNTKAKTLTDIYNELLVKKLSLIHISEPTRPY